MKPFWGLSKPQGLSSHRTDTHKHDGFIEWASQQVGQKLYLAHRLDKETSGVLLVARDANMCAKLSSLFESNQIEKSYFFLTDKNWPSEEDALVRESLIEKDKGRWISRDSSESNSETKFFLRNKFDRFSLIEASPKTGKTHQIRLHAQDLGLSILGDSLYGGKPHARLWLHSQQLRFTLDGNVFEFSTPLPRAMTEMNLLLEEHRVLLEQVVALEKREAMLELIDENNKENPKDFYPTVRLLHRDTDPLRMDQLGEVLWAGWWQERAPGPYELEDFQKLMSYFPDRPWLLQWRTNREQNKNDQAYIESKNPPMPEQWVASENSIQYLFKKQMGQSPGLFLDQRDNRKWVKDFSGGLSVLNLFSYTGGFSVAAALGGADRVVTVDASKNYIEWSKENFKLNGLDPQKPGYEFWAFDVFEFMKMRQKKKDEFDLIICDPPSFGRSQNGVFQLSKDFQKLVKTCLSLLKLEGHLLFSCNFEGWSEEQFQKLVQTLCEEQYVTLVEFRRPPFDHEGPNEEPLLKTALIKKYYVTGWENET